MRSLDAITDPKPECPPNIWALMEAVANSRLTKRPPEAFTLGQFRDKFGVSNSKALEIIRDFLHRGLIRREGPLKASWYVPTAALAEHAAIIDNPTAAIDKIRTDLNRRFPRPKNAPVRGRRNARY